MRGVGVREAVVLLPAHIGSAGLHPFGPCFHTYFRWQIEKARVSSMPSRASVRRGGGARNLCSRGGQWQFWEGRVDIGCGGGKGKYCFLRVRRNAPRAGALVSLWYDDDNLLPFRLFRTFS
jgi:hypothetical protein